MSDNPSPPRERVMSRFAADPETPAPEKPRRSESGRTRFTPLDIQSHQFGRSLRGCDPDEVTSFLRLVAEDFEFDDKDFNMLMIV